MRAADIQIGARPVEVCADEAVRVTAVQVTHGHAVPALAYRFDTADGSVVFSGDTTASDDLADFAAGADILVHHVADLDYLRQHGLSATELAHQAGLHTDVTEVGGVAERAGAGELILTHYLPAEPDAIAAADWSRRAARGLQRPHDGRVRRPARGAAAFAGGPGRVEEPGRAGGPEHGGAYGVNAGQTASAASLRKMLVPLALAQFICSFAGSNMNVMITPIKDDLHTTVQGVQVCITLFLLVMAALMIPCGKLTDRYGRKRCLTIGLAIYGVGAIVSAVSPNLGVLILGNSLLEGIGTALLIPPVYILTTMLFTTMEARARAFGAISGAGGVGAATGPLIGGAITTAISWRAAFVFQALIIVIIVVLARRITDPRPAQPGRPLDPVGAVLSAVGLVVLVGGIMAADRDLVLMLILIAAGAVILAGFVAWIRHRERIGKEPLLETALFRNRTSNYALITQNVQWAMLMGISFAVSAYLQVIRHYSPIKTGVIFTATTVGRLAVLGGSRPAGPAVRPANAHPGRLRDHHCRCPRPAAAGQGAPEPLVLGAWPVPHRRGRRADAHAVGERGAICLPGSTAGRDLRPVTQRLQPGLLLRHRDRRHHRGSRFRRSHPGLRRRHPGHGLHRADRLRRRLATAADQSPAAPAAPDPVRG